MLKAPELKGQPARPSQIVEAPSNLQVVVYGPGGDVLYNERASLRRFSSGSWGYHTAGKMDLPRVPGERLQVNIGLTVIGSKNWEPEADET